MPVISNCLAVATYVHFETVVSGDGIPPLTARVADDAYFFPEREKRRHAVGFPQLIFDLRLPFRIRAFERGSVIISGHLLCGAGIGKVSSRC